MATKSKKAEAKKENVKKATKVKEKMTGQPSMENGEQENNPPSPEDAANVADVVQNKQAT